MEIFTFFYYANEESDDVIEGSLKQYNTQSTISLEMDGVTLLCLTVSININYVHRLFSYAVFFKLGTRNVHQRKRMTPSKLLPWQHSWLQSLSVENQIFQQDFPSIPSFHQSCDQNKTRHHSMKKVKSLRYDRWLIYYYGVRWVSMTKIIICLDSLTVSSISDTIFPSVFVRLISEMIFDFQNLSI